MLNYYVKAEGLENYSDEYIKDYIYQNFPYKDLLVNVNVDRAKEQVIITVKNQLTLAAIPLIATAIASLLGPLGIFIVEITIGGAVADSLRQTAWIWIPLTIISASLIIYLYIKSKK